MGGEDEQFVSCVASGWYGLHNIPYRLLCSSESINRLNKFIASINDYVL